MDPQVSNSFIPKKPLDSGKVYHAGGGTSFLLFISLFIFIVSVCAAGAAFGYQGILTASIANKSSSLEKAEGAFDLSTIQDLIRMDARINNASTLLQNHVAPSAIFAFLGQQTLQAVQFTSFSYSLNADNSASISLAGQADTFSTVALQSDQFGANKLLKNVVFSGITVGSSGKVTFSVAATLDGSVLNYGKNLGNVTQVPLAPPVQPQATSSTPAPAH